MAVASEAGLGAVAVASEAGVGAMAVASVAASEAATVGAFAAAFATASSLSFSFHIASFAGSWVVEQPVRFGVGV